MVKKQRNNLAIFGPFLDLQKFFLNRGLSFETSDSGFCDLLDELFHMVQKNFFRKKSKLQVLFQSPIRIKYYDPKWANVCETSDDLCDALKNEWRALRVDDFQRRDHRLYQLIKDFKIPQWAPNGNYRGSRIFDGSSRSCVN